MLTQKRHEEILRILKENGAVSVSELTGILDASESTVRRDLVSLSKSGKINKVHGGATLNEKDYLTNEAAMEEKIAVNTENKTAIAKYAALQIADDDFIYIDAGTTTMLIADYITAKNISIVTNGIAHAKKFAAKGFKTIVLGGLLKASTEAIVGLTAADSIKKYNFNKAFIGTNGISKDLGYTTPDSDEAFLKKAAIENSFVSYILGDSSKLNKVSRITFAKLEQAVLITDRLSDNAYKDLTDVREVL